jgi:predicted enzyme related to lactoylglutathione lyase
MPSFWLPYFMVTDVDATTARATTLGGKAHFGPQDIPGTGRFAVIADPQGAAFAVFAPAAR